MSNKNKEKSTPKNDEDKKQTVSPEVAKKVAEDEKKKADKKKADEKRAKQANEEADKKIKEAKEKKEQEKKDKEAKKMKKKKVEVPGEHGKPFGGNDRASRCAK